MTAEILQGIFIPFLGTSLGAAMVFFMRNSLPNILTSINCFSGCSSFTSCFNCPIIIFCSICQLTPTITTMSHVYQSKHTVIT